MDQAKVYLGVAKKHHFWILAVVVLVTATTVWAKASGNLKTQYETHMRTIDGAEKSLTGIPGEKVNEGFTKKVETLHEDLKQRVFEAWKKLYERQFALLKWPVKETEAGEIDLNKYEPNKDIPEFVRMFYNENVVRDEWEELLSKVDLRRPIEVADPTEEESGDKEEGEEVVKRGTEYQGLVVWKDDLRKAIALRYYRENATPSTLRLRLMQEDAWLFDSLVQVVNTVNFGATDPLRAPIKQIDVLDVAQWATDASQQSGAGIWTPGSSGSAGAAGGPGTTGGGMTGGGMTGGGMTGGGMTGGGMTGGATAAAGDEDKEWEDGRYLDDKGQPLKAGTPHPFAEFRQVFVYMKFVMDQRRIPDLVAACANAPLPVETRQIRVQTLKEGDLAAGGGNLFGPAMGGGGMGGGGMGGGMGGGAGKGGGGMGGGQMPGMMGRGMGGGMMGGGMMGGPMGGGMGGPMGGGPMGGGMGGPMGGGMTGGGMMGGGMMGGDLGGAGPGAVEGAVETTDYDAVVELSGVIYLYNFPDITKLGTGGAGSPEKRTFGVPTTSVRVPGNSAGGGMSGGPMMTGGPTGK